MTPRASIELSDVETALRACGGVRSAMVVRGAGVGGAECLIAYVVLDEAGCSWRNLRAALCERCSPEIVPARYVVLEQLPAGDSESIDHDALARSSAEVIEFSHAYVAPLTVEEEVMAGIWQDVFEMTRIGIDDNFFELGGDSLDALKILARVSHELSLDVSLEVVFDRPTIRDLADVLRDKAGAGLPRGNSTRDN